METQEAIAYRKTLINRAVAGQKLTKNERAWLTSNPIYNDAFGYPYLNVDILQIRPRTDYTLHIKLLSCPNETRGLPFVGIPLGDGFIQASGAIKDLDGKTFFHKKVKLLGVEVDNLHRESTLLIRSALGLLSIAYEYDYKLEGSPVIVRKSSSSGDLRYAMRRIDESGSYIYQCKQPDSDNMNALTFSIALQPCDSCRV